MTSIEQRSLAVDNPAIDEVLNLASGEILPVQAVIGNDYEKTLKLRMSLRQHLAAGTPLYACPIPIHLVSQMQQRQFYFRHETEDSRCPAKTKGQYDEKRILAMEHDGARESLAHIRMKNIIAESLRCDSDFSNVEIEPVWKGAEANQSRRPDVKALWRNSLPAAFEVQLSTTFLRVIAERREFYLREGGLLLWVFKNFDMGDAKLTQEDIFYNNNRNAFIVSEDTLIASKTKGKMALNCIWSEPSLDEGRLLWNQKTGQATFDQLTIDRVNQRIFLFDADTAKDMCTIEAHDGQLRAEFQHYWQSETADTELMLWQDLCHRFALRGFSLPTNPVNPKGPWSLLNALYSARVGKPVGWRFENLVKVAHHVFDKYKGALWAFKLVLAAHDRGAQIVAEDTTKRWQQNKVRKYRLGWSTGDAEFAPDRCFDELICFLFPEIADRLPLAPS